MANEFIAQLNPRDSISLVGGHPALIPVNLATGLAFGPGLPEPFVYIPEACYWKFFVPAAATLGTGITASLVLVDDPNAPSPGGLVTFDIAYALVTSGTSLDLDSAFSAATVDAVQATMPSGTPWTGKQLVSPIATIAAHFGGSLAADTWGIVRVRRNPPSSGTLDTHLGRAVLIGLSLRNT